MEDALKKLDKLTQEEARMAVAQNLKATHTVDERVRGVANAVGAIEGGVADVNDRIIGVDVRVAGVDDRVAGVDNLVARVDDRVARVDDRVARVDDRVARVDDRVARVDDRVVRATDVIDDGVKGVREQVLVVDDRIKQTADDIGRGLDQVKRSSYNFLSTDYRVLHTISENQLRENIHKWLSPPDPSTNHNIACGTHHKKAATWFFRGTFFREWKSTGSLLWIYGKRTACLTSHLILSDEILNRSWLWQEHSLVSRVFRSILRM